MDETIILIKDFQRSIAEVVELFYSEFGRRDLQTAFSEKLYPRNGCFGKVMKRYFFHGSGLSVYFKDKIVDFDFGLDEQVDGFDAWTLWGFASSQAKYRQKWTHQAIIDNLVILELEKKIYKLPNDKNYYLVG